MTASLAPASTQEVAGGTPCPLEAEPSEILDTYVAEIRAKVEEAIGTEKTAWADQLDAVREQVTAEKRGEVADEFDGIHNIDRARKVGSVDQIIPPSGLRPYLISAVQRGIERAHSSGPAEWSPGSASSRGSGATTRRSRRGASMLTSGGCA